MDTRHAGASAGRIPRPSAHGPEGLSVARPGLQGQRQRGTFAWRQGVRYLGAMHIGLSRRLLLAAPAAVLLSPAMARAQGSVPDPRTAALRLIERLMRLDEDGLDPAHYAIPGAELATSDPDAFRQALHRAAADALTDLLLGRARDIPGRPDIRRDPAAVRLEQWQQELASSYDPASVIERAALRPEGAAILKSELARLRALARVGGWPVLPSGDTLDPGMVDPVRVPLLRGRMAAEGFWPAGNRDAGELYDPLLEGAVRRWQSANGLEADGRVGRISQSLLSRPIGARIDQLRVALDMRRGAAPEGPERRIEVNIPDYRLSVREAGREILSMAVVVGRPSRATPLMRVRLTAAQFNPPWGVPERNAREDLLPRFRRDPQAMMEKGFRVYSFVGGERVEVDPRTIDWNSINPQRFPYIIRQDAGDANALGRIKLIMPNGDDIFMHDTPDRHHFRRPDRAFSSGCIRLEQPMELLELLLEGTPGWDLDRAQRALDSRVTSVVSLRRTLPVRLHYTTVTTEGGHLRIRPDIYGLDAAYARAMAAPRGPVVAQAATGR